MIDSITMPPSGVVNIDTFAFFSGGLTNLIIPNTITAVGMKNPTEAEN